MKYAPQIIELTDGTKCVYLEDFRRECDEAQVAIRALAEHAEAEIQRITKERDEASEQLRMASIEVNARQEIANALKERDEAREAWHEMQSSFERSRDEVEKLICERDEVRAITKEAITGLYNLGDYDLANRLSSKLEETK